MSVATLAANHRGIIAKFRTVQYWSNFHDFYYMVKTMNKAEIIRHTRNCARLFKARKGVYSRIHSWMQEDVGGRDEKHIVKLKYGWSFFIDENINCKSFKNVDSAMIGIRKTVQFSSGPKGQQFCTIEQRKRDWQQKLDELKKSFTR